jgi:hypothetical protein
VRKLAAGLSFVALLPACSRPPRDPVQAVVEGAVKAAEKRDADAVVAFLAPAFRDAGGGDRDEVAATVRRYLAGYEGLSLKVSNLVIERGPGSAQARFTMAMSGTPRAVAGLEGWLPRTSRWRFDLRLEPGDRGWKITHAAWTRLEEGG